MKSREAFLLEVSAGLAADLAARPHASLALAASPLCLAPTAKRARPALAYELARLGGLEPGPALVDAAIMIELMHTASLVHDDVVDGAVSRRGLPALNAELGNATAVLVGDDILVRALLRVADRPPLVHAGLDALGIMVNAVAAEVAARGHVDLTPMRWIDLAAGKTAVLFALCGRVVGLLAGKPELGERLAAAGRHLGLAFQAADDVADFLVGHDLEERNPNLAVIHASATPAVALALAAAWARNGPQPGELPRLRQAIRETGALERCQATLDVEVAAADRLLAPLAATAPEALRTIRAWAAQLTAPLATGAAA